MDVSTPNSSAAVSPLRQRMLDDMRMRQFAEHTQEGRGGSARLNTQRPEISGPAAVSCSAVWS